MNWKDASRQTVILLSFPLVVIHINLQPLDLKVDLQDGKLSRPNAATGLTNQQPMYSNESTSGPKPQFEMGKLSGSASRAIS